VSSGREDKRTRLTSANGHLRANTLAVPDAPVQPPFLTMGICMKADGYEKMICGMSAMLMTMRTVCSEREMPMRCYRKER